jgi:Spy/CpxP family protein refolding chaperone
MGGGQGMGMYLSDRMLDRINATPEQRTQLRKIAQDGANELRAQHEAGRALRDQMAQLFSQPAIDARAVEALRQQMLAHHDQASKRRMQALLDASSVLTAEQRKQVADLRTQRRAMMERHWRERRSLETAPKS